MIDFKTKYDVPSPEELIKQADKKESSLLTDANLLEVINPMEDKDQYFYVKGLLKTYDKNDKSDAVIRAMTPVKTTDLQVRLSKFKEQKGREPYQREKDEIHQEIRDAIKLHTNEYWELRDEAQQIFKRLKIKVQEKGINISSSNNDKERPANYRGELTDECIEDLEELAEIYPDMAINEFFETAYNQKESCRKAVKIVDGESKKVDIKWSTLRDRVDNLGREDIYYRSRPKRKK